MQQPAILLVALFAITSTVRAQLTIPGLESSPIVTEEGERHFYSIPKPDSVTSDEYSYPLDNETKSFDDVTNFDVPKAGDLLVTMSSDLMKRFVEDQRFESNNVVTQVMEASVRGTQRTTTNVSLQTLPGDSMARLNILAEGSVNSNTIGYTSQARIASLGNHTFQVIKPVYFDGTRFLTKPAHGSLQARQFPQAVNTIASGMPLIGPIGERMAWNEVRRRQPQSDAIVVRRVASDVLPKVNASVDAELTRVNRLLRGAREKFRDVVGNDRITWSASSTERTFSTQAVNNSLRRRGRKSAAEFSAQLALPEALAVMVSEDGVNHALDEIIQGGLTITDTTLQSLAASVRTREVELATLQEELRSSERDTTPLLFSIRLAESSPVSMDFEDGLLQANLKFQVLPKLGEPSQMLSMNLQLAGRNEADGKWSLFVKSALVEPASQNEQPGPYVAIINSQAENVLKFVPPSDLPRQIDLRRWHAKLPVVRIHRIQALNGQLRVSFREDESSSSLQVSN